MSTGHIYDWPDEEDRPRVDKWTYALLFLIFAAVLFLSACGSKATRVDTYRVDDRCYVSIQKDKPADNDEDITYPIPCEFPEVSVVP